MKIEIEKIKRRHSFISKGKYKNRQNYEWYGISNRRTISKFANFWNFDRFPNWKNSEHLLIFQFGEFQQFPIEKHPNISNLENYQIFKTVQFGKLSNIRSSSIWKINEFSKLKNMEYWKILTIWKTWKKFVYEKL